MFLEVSKGGQIIYQDKADRSLINLLTKKYNPKTKYSSKAIEIFNNLNMLSNMPKHKSSQKSKLGGNIYYTNPNELFKKLQLISGSRIAGNTNIRLKNEAYQIIDKLLELGAINKSQYDKYVQKHLI